MRRPTQRETEIKLAVANLPALVCKLKRLGYRCDGRVIEQNTLYDTPDSSFRRRGRLLRIRTEAPAPSPEIRAGRRRAVLTSKSPAPASRGSRFKEKLEREVVSRSAEGWPAALRSLGLRPGFRYEKYRTTFHLRGLHAELDETPVGVFLELEGTPRAIDRAAHALGFTRRDYIRGTYWDLNAAACRRRGRIPGNMLFSA